MAAVTRRRATNHRVGLVMTFDEWWIEYRGFSDPYDGQAREAWNAAVKACAEAVYDATSGMHDEADMAIKEEIAAKIMAMKA